MSPTPTVRPLSVLVVDDCRDTADSLAVLLHMAGHDARVAYDGAGALAQLNGWQPAVVLMDIRLPGCDGIELRERLCREAKRRPTMIAITGLGTRDDLEEVKAAGFDHVFLRATNTKTVGGVARG